MHSLQSMFLELEQYTLDRQNGEKKKNAFINLTCKCGECQQYPVSLCNQVIMLNKHANISISLLCICNLSYSKCPILGILCAHKPPSRLQEYKSKEVHKWLKKHYISSEQALINGKQLPNNSMISVSVKQWWCLFYWNQDAGNEQEEIHSEVIKTVCRSFHLMPNT